MRLDAEVLAAAVLDSPDGVSLIDAPERHVFDVKSFRGQWHAPSAYAQWFIDNPEGDWAPAINNSLKIDTEAVRLPGRICRIGSTIQMPVKSRLIGTTRGMSQIDKDDYFGTILIPIVSSDNKVALTANVMITLNVRANYFDGFTGDYFNWIKNTKQNLTSDEQSKEGAGTWPSNAQFPTPLAAIKDIYLFGYNPFNSVEASSQEAKTRRGIFIAGSATLEGLVFRGFQQAVAWSHDYADAKEVHHCTVHEPNDKTNAREVYAIDMGFLGDAMIFEGNHIGSEQGKALNINSCGGGIISANILNADVRIANSKGIVYSGNHSESGPQISIYNSTVQLIGNYFEKGERPNIRIESGQYGNSSVVSLNGNIYSYFTQSKRPSCLSPGQDIVLEDISEYDVEVFATSGQSTLTALNISNEMRCYIPAGAFGNMHTTGIAICRSYISNDKSVIVPVTEFNSRSQILSRDCKLAILWNNANRVQYPPFRVENIANPNVSFGTTNGLWNKAPGNYSYHASIIYDISRRIGKIYAGSTTCYVTQGKSVMITLSNADATCGKQAMIRLHRTMDSDNPQYVDVPMCVAANCYDIGSAINGFKWKDGKGNIDFNPSIVSMEYRGENVVAWATAQITDTSGWQRGDIIYNVGTDTSWSIQIIK